MSIIKREIVETRYEEGYSPGPWFNKVDELEVCKGDNVIVASVKCTHDDFKNGVWQANAELMAAAPELYECLDEVFDEIGKLDTTISIGPVQERALALLARLKGEDGS